MTRDVPFTAAEDSAQRESDRQRWADDGGRSADPAAESAPHPAPLPVRPVYLRRVGARPHSLSSARRCDSVPAP